METEKIIRLSVRNLVEFILKEGDIDNRISGTLDKDAMLMGGRLHRKIQRMMGSNYQAEVSLKLQIPCDGFQLKLEGRADGILLESEKTIIDEIKGVVRSLDRVERPVPVHLAQAKCYAYIYARQQGLKQISVQMTYCNLDTEDVKRFREEYTFEELEKRLCDIKGRGVVLRNGQTLQDLYEELLRQPEPEARRVATALELYCTGSLNLFNHPTNVDLNSRVVCIVLKGLGENLRKIAMHTTNEFVTAAVNANHAEGVATWCYFDEFHILLRDPLTASYFVAVWKMLRKKGCVPSALTQNVKDLLASREIENILDNTDFMILLSQAQSDRAILAKQIGISEHQLSYITQSNSGEGLLFYGSVTIPFVDRFPRGEIYDLLTTKPEDAANGKQTE